MLYHLTKIIVSGIIFFGLPSVLCAQTQQKTPIPQPTVEQPEEILKVQTKVIQTGVMVFGKDGKRIDNLKQEDFELQVDGKPTPISFFEKISSPKSPKDTTGQGNEGKTNSSNTSASTSIQGRNIIFVVDDIHLSVENTNRTRKSVNKFIDQDILPNDTVAIVSTSGKIGFLQQFTNNKAVLKAAAEKIIYSRNYSANDKMQPPMTEYEALLVSQRDSQVTAMFVGLDPTPGDSDSKSEAVRMRARAILLNAAAFSRITYDVLDKVVRSSTDLPGRKIVFFISDGFISDPINSDYSYRMRRITDAASRSNTVIYSFDAKGLEAGFPEEGSTANSPQLGFRVQSGERTEFQTPLGELADSTGGKFVRNTNDLQTELEKSLEEASTYYLLAWQPDDEAETKSGKYNFTSKKIKVEVKAHPELKVRFQKSYFAGNGAEENKENGKKNQSAISPVNKQLNDAIGRQMPVENLPTLLAVNHLNSSTDGDLLMAALQIEKNSVEFVNTSDTSTAEIDILGILYNAEGKQEDLFRKLMTISIPLSKISETKSSKIYYNYQTKIKPGLYQFRVATRDVQSGRIGSANQWIEIPDLSSKKLSLSSILIGEVADKRLSQGENKNSALDNVQISVDRRFKNSSTLRYLIFVYNSSSKNSVSPDITIQTKIFSNGKTILESPAQKISSEGQDLERLAYAAEIPLNRLNPGNYLLQVTVQNQVSKEISLQQTNFQVE